MRPPSVEMRRLAARLDAVPKVRVQEPLDHRVGGALAARQHHHSCHVVQALEIVDAARVGAHDPVDEALERAALRGKAGTVFTSRLRAAADNSTAAFARSVLATRETLTEMAQQTCALVSWSPSLAIQAQRSTSTATVAESVWACGRTGGQSVRERRVTRGGGARAPNRRWWRAKESQARRRVDEGQTRARCHPQRPLGIDVNVLAGVPDVHSEELWPDFRSDFPVDAAWGEKRSATVPGGTWPDLPSA